VLVAVNASPRPPTCMPCFSGSKRAGARARRLWRWPPPC